METNSSNDPSAAKGKTPHSINASVDVYNNGVLAGRASVAGNQWSLTLSSLSYGLHTLKASSGGQNSNNWTLSVARAEATPTMTQVRGNSGAVPPGGSTTDTDLTFSGSAEPNTSLELKDGVSRLGTTTSNGSGTWTLTISGMQIKSYSVTANTSAGTSAPPWVFTINAPAFYVDPSPVSLNGHSYLNINSYMAPPRWPANTTVRREATGGKPPYTYSYSPPGVVQREADGLIHGVKNGATTVTITDSANQQATFTVTVSNLKFWSVVTGESDYASAVRIANSRGLHVPDITQLREFQVMWSGFTPIPQDGYFWSSSKSGLSHLTKRMSDGAEVTMSPIVFGGRGLGIT
jgi:hypothetical protein